MTVTLDRASRVVGGADTHADTIHVAAIDEVGRDLGDREFPTTPLGYRDALDFLTAFGDVSVLGIEGTSSFGTGLAWAAKAAGIAVREVIRPERSVRRLQGKSDPIDAYQAARAVLSGRAQSAPKSQDIEALRALLNARRSAVKARTAAMNQIHAMLITAPVELREKYRSPQGEAAGQRPGNLPTRHQGWGRALSAHGVENACPTPPVPHHTSRRARGSAQGPGRCFQPRPALGQGSRPDNGCPVTGHRWRQP
ncbi:MAG: transposase [Nocardioidaceae bacterium]